MSDANIADNLIEELDKTRTEEWSHYILLVFYPVQLKDMGIQTTK